MATVTAAPHGKRQVESMSQTAPEPKLDPGNTASPLLFVMLAFLVVFPWIAQLLPYQVREYIGLLFR